MLRILSLPYQLPCFLFFFFSLNVSNGSFMRKSVVLVLSNPMGRKIISFRVVETCCHYIPRCQSSILMKFGINVVFEKIFEYSFSSLKGGKLTSKLSMWNIIIFCVHRWNCCFLTANMILRKKQYIRKTVFLGYYFYNISLMCPSFISHTRC